jgi:orotate phosphoribosyltransferase
MNPVGLLREMVERNIIMFGEFTLSSGLKSPYYIDLRRSLSYPDIFSSIIELYLSKLDEVGDFDIVSGIESGSIAYAAVLAYRLNIPMIYVRKRRKGYGAGRFIEGSLDEGSRVLVIEDVSTTGGSILRAVEAIRMEGGVVDSAITFIDREQGAYELLRDNDVTLYSIFKISDIFERLYSSHVIDEVLYSKLVRYVGGYDVYG